MGHMLLLIGEPTKNSFTPREYGRGETLSVVAFSPVWRILVLIEERGLILWLKVCGVLFP